MITATNPAAAVTVTAAYSAPSLSSRAPSQLEDIDLYGMLELSSDEMPHFLGELDPLLSVAVDEREREVLAAVRRAWPNAAATTVI